MTQLVTWFTAIVVIAAAMVWGISTYLAPDDLAMCPQGPDSAKADCRKADAIITISGGDTESRTFEAVRLYKAGWADRMIFSGAALDSGSPSNARAMQLLAIESGVPSNAISTEDLARDTNENALRTRQLATEQGLKRVIVVTSAYHQRRASVEFKRVFNDTEVIDHPVPRDRQWSDAWWLTPVGWWLAISELVKIAIVSLRGSL